MHTHAKGSHTHVKDPVVHVRLGLIMKTQNISNMHHSDKIISFLIVVV